MTTRALLDNEEIALSTSLQRDDRANAAWLEPWWAGKPRGFMLGKNAITHNALHLGEAPAIRSQLGWPATK